MTLAVHMCHHVQAMFILVLHGPWLESMHHHVILQPASGGKRTQQAWCVQVKMVTSDDEQTTDIIAEGDKEEIERMRQELALWEKGKIYVKGILEN